EVGSELPGGGRARRAPAGEEREAGAAIRPAEGVGEGVHDQVGEDRRRPRLRLEGAAGLEQLAEEEGVQGPLRLVHPSVAQRLGIAEEAHPITSSSASRAPAALIAWRIEIR